MHSPVRVVERGKAAESSPSPRARVSFAWGRALLFRQLVSDLMLMRSGYANVPRTLVSHCSGGLRPLLGVGWDAFPRSGGRTGEGSRVLSLSEGSGVFCLGSGPCCSVSWSPTSCLPMSRAHW